LPSTAFINEAQSLKDWIIQKALPFWANIARDTNGGFYEDLTLSGIPNRDAIRRVRVQARQVFVYAQAQRLGWYEGAPIADKTFKFMREHGYTPDGQDGFVHLIDSNYTAHDSKRDLYDHAFHALACASLMECSASKEAVAAKRLNQDILDFIDIGMGACEGWTEGVPSRLPRRQNPHMHLFETSMALYDATKEERYLQRAARIYHLFESYFFDPVHNIIREFFDENWAPLKNALGDTAEPGHACEWVWLLWQYERRSGVNTKSYREALYKTAFANNTLYLNDESDVFGNIRRGTRRLWVQTEVIRAHLAMMEAGTHGAEDHALTILKSFTADYLNENGTWNDCFDEAGRMIAKTIPTSTFYHIMGMVIEATRLAQLD